MSQPIVIVGVGGFGREVHDILDAINAVEPTWDLLGYIDDTPSEDNLQLIEARGSRVLGGVSALEDMPGVQVSFGIGNGSIRRSLDASCQRWGLDAPVLRHPSATWGHDVACGPGTIICAGARLTTHIRLGRHVHVNINATVGHDCTLGDYVTVSPLAAISGSVQIGDESMLGTGSAINPRRLIGTRSVVGAGSCVVRDVPDDTTVKGVPAR